MSPVGENFRLRCRQVASLINSMTIDWFNEWSENALVAVADRYFGELDMSSNYLKSSLRAECANVHNKILKKNVHL